MNSPTTSSGCYYNHRLLEINFSSEKLDLRSEFITSVARQLMFFPGVKMSETPSKEKPKKVPKLDLAI